MAQLNQKCFHRIVQIDEPPFKWHCLLCGKKLKIESGVVVRTGIVPKICNTVTPKEP